MPKTLVFNHVPPKANSVYISSKVTAIKKCPAQLSNFDFNSSDKGKCLFYAKCGKHEQVLGVTQVLLLLQLVNASVCVYLK